MTATLLRAAPGFTLQDGEGAGLPARVRASEHVVDVRTRSLPQVGSTRRPSVLLVEDEADLRRLVRRYLERSEAFTIAAEAENGQEALEVLASSQPDIILLDLVMPVMGGHEALPKLVRTAPRSMIVILSALDAAVEEDAALSAGAFAYVEKTSIGASFSQTLLDLHGRFTRALDGETVWAPEPPRR